MAKEQQEKSCRARKWIFTAQGLYELDDIKNHYEGVVKDKVSYIKVALEEGETGNYHLQGYLELHNKVSMSGCRAIFSMGKLLGENFTHPHLEIAWNPQKAHEYIGNKDFVHADGKKKGGEILWVWGWGEFIPDKGEVRRQGKSWNDSLLEIKALIDGGCEIYELWQSHFIQMVYTGRQVKEYYQLSLNKAWGEVFEKEWIKAPIKERMEALQDEIDKEAIQDEIDKEAIQ